MGRKLLSFLGTNRYVASYYYLNGQGIGPVTFIQEALVRMLCKDWHENDRICIFCTKDAEERNWQDKAESQRANFENGLYSRLLALNLKPKIEKISIPEGRSEEEILNIFQIVFETLEENDHIIFDITHSFRSLPMLNLVVLNYAKFLKNIRLEGIYYGAFEVLGNPREVEKNIPLEKRNAPIFDLTPYAKLLEWSWAVSDFVRYGHTKHLKELVEEKINPILAQTAGADKTAKALKKLVKALDNLSNNILCNRGKKILEQQSFEELIEDLETAELLPPFRPLLKKIKEKTAGFKQDKIKNGFVAAKWCLDHGLIPQGITILEETIISFFCEKYGLNMQKKDDRELISQVIQVRANNLPKNEWKGILKRRQEIAEKIFQTLPEEVCKFFKNLAQVRNDINHGGFNKDARGYQKFNQHLKDFLQEAHRLIWAD